MRISQDQQVQGQVSALSGVTMSLAGPPPGARVSCRLGIATGLRLSIASALIGQDCRILLVTWRTLYVSTMKLAMEIAIQDRDEGIVL